MLQTEKRKMRDEKILLRLDSLTYATRSQLQEIERLGGDRNAHRILHRLEKEKSISSIRQEKKIYYLNGRGQRHLGLEKGNKEFKRAQIKHILMRNDLYIHLGMPHDWRVEVPIKFNDEILIPDAMFTQQKAHVFVEIDNMQIMRANYEKIKQYQKLSKVIFRQYNHHPTLLWYTRSEVRKEKLTKACYAAGIKFAVFTDLKK